VSAFVIGFVVYWKLTLILTSTLFAIVFLMGAGSTYIVKYSKQSTNAYAEGGTVAEEVISSIRNCVSFGTQDRLAKQYDVHLTKAEGFGFRQKAAIGCMIAGMMLLLYLNYGLAFWMGSRYLIDGVIPLSKVLTINMAVMIGAFNLGSIAPNAQAFSGALGAAAKIFSSIDRKSYLDPTSEEGDRIPKLSGRIQLKHVKHIYPSRPGLVVMDDVTLDIPEGKVTALVGASGSGKSTIIGLIERFYDPVGGTIYLDGKDIKKLNLRWLRQNISLVQQEPVLFGTSIYNNIRYGLTGTEWENANAEAQKKLIYEAARRSNADKFIMSLPEGYDTDVGERGFLLSGGQKQRISIARAIVSDPRILLLDEATSALDTRSEGVVQKALDTASAGRTTITIAHRLSTIKDAHNIVVMSNGRIVEQGRHDELLEKQGAYYNLCTAQQIAQENELSTEEEQAVDEKQEELIRKLSSATGKAGASGSIADVDTMDMREKLNRSTTTKSYSSLALQGKEPEDEKRYGLWTLIKLIASFNKPEMLFMLIGLGFSFICGAGNPVQALFFAKLITTLSVQLTPANIPQVQSDVSFWCLMYLMLAIVMFISYTVQGVMFGKCSERLIHRVRDRSFRTMLRQDVSFFDSRTSGALTSFLSTQTTHVAGLSGSTLGTLISVTTTLAVALIMSIAIGWKLALVCTATVPVLLATGFLRFHMLAKFQRRAKNAYNQSATYASEAITAIRTVASLTREQDVLRQYQSTLDIQQRQSLISVLKSR